MNRLNWRLMIGIVLVGLSALVYGIHFLIFRDSHHIFIYLVGDIAFVFIEVLLVTLIIDQILHEREKRSLLHKLNMIIGIFFTEAGSGLLRLLSGFDPETDGIRKELIELDRLDKHGFSNMSKRIQGQPFKMDSRGPEMGRLKDFLREKRDFLLRILENPNMLEHERFTDTLWAVLHLPEELSCRKNLNDLPGADYAHLAIDMRRAYKSLISEWLNYMAHLKRNYPYLFSLAIRTNPFNPEATPEVKE